MTIERQTTMANMTSSSSFLSSDNNPRGRCVRNCPVNGHDCRRRRHRRRRLGTTTTTMTVAALLMAMFLLAVATTMSTKNTFTVTAFMLINNDAQQLHLKKTKTTNFGTATVIIPPSTSRSHRCVFPFSRHLSLKSTTTTTETQENNNDLDTQYSQGLEESRRSAIRRLVARSAFIAGATATTTTTRITSTMAVAAAETTASPTKLTNLSNEKMAELIKGDVVERQFLVTANLSRELYDESSTFTDEIDTYELDKWITGTRRLFVASKSQVELEPNSLSVDESEASFRFSEYLCFNIPLLNPVVYLSGKVVLKRDPVTGLITSYQEIWDQDVSTVLKTAKFFS
jgi:hypothetical protein